tara:strand:+ start:57721 stop:58233 length:513 start_codon:yes stop_codon:yes gene_type:complete
MSEPAADNICGFEQCQDGALLIVRDRVRQAWVDHNGHMNVAAYLTAFDSAICTFCTAMAIGPDQIEKTGKTIFVAQANLIYLSELMEGAPVRTTLQVLAQTVERVHVYLSLFDEDSNRLAAVNEQLLVCVDLNTRRPANLPVKSSRNFQKVFAKQQNLAVPRFVGRRIVL